VSLLSLESQSNVVNLSQFIAKKDLSELVGTYENEARYGNTIVVAVDLTEDKLIISMIEEGEEKAARAEYPIRPGEMYRQINHPIIGRAMEHATVIVDQGHFLIRRISTGSIFTIEEFLEITYQDEIFELRTHRQVLRRKYLVSGAKTVDHLTTVGRENNFRETLLLEKTLHRPLDLEELKHKIVKRPPPIELKAENNIVPFKTSTCRKLFTSHSF